ncbi:hypothetical protein [Stenotrophomonas maltophilia]|uniref:hypothetical protein n=1 Tax=Stenotrophomonas maltophilia TaxID=40324 RepID=UPI0021CA2DFB|nr:hypothetical protein [Stenotrophomonas maltophilia]MCU1136788.1 hypothetical protein [Stenotrophomonas maltophilia]
MITTEYILEDPERARLIARFDCALIAVRVYLQEQQKLKSSRPVARVTGSRHVYYLDSSTGHLAYTPMLADNTMDCERVTGIRGAFDGGKAPDDLKLKVTALEAFLADPSPSSMSTAEIGVLECFP